MVVVAAEVVAVVEAVAEAVVVVEVVEVAAVDNSEAFNII